MGKARPERVSWRHTLRGQTPKPPMIDQYCERIAPGFWAEPLNALTNVAFLAAAFAAWRLAARRDALDRVVWLLLTLIAAIGIGSFLFHTLATYWAMASDVTPIVLFQIVYVWAYVGGVMRRDRAAQWAAGLALVALLIAATPFTRFANGSPAYLPALLVLTGLGVYQLRHAAGGRRVLLAAAALLAVSLLLRTVDLELCRTIPIGTHFLWHLINGGVLYLAMRGLLLARAPDRAAPR